ncbi:hypothetical protein SteCoe_20761 [Stentor coeruleus]|uniref:Mitochondrial carrier protein n=1 Tax=Stentor coeruleus TaxID=5963 RepID=A0A1R2BR39_9CILI|nr:hypothetical protein SteCoe_20761 [Stentor coeruleus]
MEEQYPIVLTSISAFISGGIARMVVHPLDTIKAKLQVQQGNKSPEFLTITQAFKTTLAKEGYKGLYKGLTFSAFGCLPAVCLYFTSYELSKKYLLEIPAFKNNNFLAYLTSGMIAEAISCMFFVPIDVIKERLQVQSNLKEYNYANGRNALKILLSKEGLRGIYRAYGATVASFGPFSGLYFLFYEYSKHYFVGGHKEISFFHSVLCAGFAGSLSAWITNPLDIAKVRMQVVRAIGKSKFPYKNMFHGIYLIASEEGFRALFQGSLARILFHTPNTAISMSLVEFFRRLLSNDI